MPFYMELYASGAKDLDPLDGFGSPQSSSVKLADPFIDTNGWKRTIGLPHFTKQGARVDPGNVPKRILWSRRKKFVLARSKFAGEKSSSAPRLRTLWKR